MPLNEDPEKVANEQPLEYLFDRALRGDAEALEHFFTLMEANREMVVGRMQGLGTGAQTDTVEEVFQNTVVDLWHCLEAGTVPNLREEDRKDILKYFQRRCDGRLRDYVRPRLSPALARHKPPVPEQVPDLNARIPGEQRHTEHLALIDDAARRLSPENAEILRMFRSGMSYKEMARLTGKKEETLRNAIVRIREQLQQDIIPRSQTAELHFRREHLPSWKSIQGAIADLPPEIHEAICFVHMETHSVDDLARRLGDRGFEKAKARLTQGYRTLTGKLGFPFPDAFTMLGLKAARKRLTRRDIEAVVDKLPPINKDAFLFVHVEDHCLEELAQRVGDDDLVRVQERLEEAYRLLNQSFNEIFPDAWERAL